MQLKPTILMITGLILGLFTGCQKEKFETATAIEEQFHIQCGDYPVPVLVRGNTASGKILLYVQGGPGLHTLDYATIDYPEWRNSLEKEYAIAYYDQRGTGNRQDHFKIEDISVTSYLEDIHCLAGALQSAYKADIILMGHSFGGGMVYRYMHYYGAEGIPTQYISFNGPATTDKDTIRWTFRREFLYQTALMEIQDGQQVAQWEEVLAWLDKTPVIADVEGENKWRDKDQWNDYVDELIIPKFPYKSPSFGNYMRILFASTYNPTGVYTGGHVIEQVQQQLFQDEYAFQLINRLDSVQGPLLLITGRYDDICPPQEMQYIYDHVGTTDKTLVILEDASHDSFLHQPEEFVSAIRQFIQ